MTQKPTEITYMTLRQFAEKHHFTTVEGLRFQVYNNTEFKKECVRRLGKKLLLNEEKVLDYIENSKYKIK